MPGHLSAAEAPEDLWTCHDCGWTYPNHHPSAKHRRNHKKVCGSIPGFTGTISSKKAEPEPASSVIDGASSDDASSDDETTPNKTHDKRGHHHTTQKVAPAQQTVAAAGGTRAAKSLCATHRSRELCLHSEEANMKPAPLTERTFSDQNNRQALQSTGSTGNTTLKPQHVRRRSAHALEGVWVCRHCGWTYPNAHPSAKHRRKHKKKCPALVVTPRHVVGAGGSSDDASSDEENKRGDAAPENQEDPETNISSTTSSVPNGLEAFLGRSDSKRELRELQDTIILLSPKPMSRRNSFKSPRQRRDGPSGLLSPRSSTKNSKAVTNNQVQEVLTVTERKAEVVSDQENEDPVVLSLPAARVLTRPVPATENVVGGSLPDGRGSSSDESDLNNSDGGTPSSPDSVLQPVHLLLPVTTSTTSEETQTSDQDETDEDVTEQPLHQEATVAAAALKLDVETERDETTNEVAVEQDEYESGPQLSPLNCEASSEVDTLISADTVAPTAYQMLSYEVSSVNSCETVDARPCIELHTAVTRTICVAKETEVAARADEKIILPGWKYVASSLVIKPTVATAVKPLVEPSALDSDIAVEHVAVEALVLEGFSDETSVDNEHHDLQEANEGEILIENGSVSIPTIGKLLEGQSCKELDSIETVMIDTMVADVTETFENDVSLDAKPGDEGKAGDLKLDSANPLQTTDFEDKSGSDAAEEGPHVLSVDQLPAEASVLAVKAEEAKNAQTLSSLVPSLDEIVKEEHHKNSKISRLEAVSPDKPTVEVTVEAAKEKKDWERPLSSEVPSADQTLVECASEVAREDRDLRSLSFEGLSLEEPSALGTVVEQDEDLPLISSEVSPLDQSSVECTSDFEEKNIPRLSCEGFAADQHSVHVSGEVATEGEEILVPNTEGVGPSESLRNFNSQSTMLISEVRENTNIWLDSFNAPGVQPTSVDSLELSSESTSTATPTIILSSILSPDAVIEDDSSSELSANKKVEEPLDIKPNPGDTPSTAMRFSDLKSEALPTPKSRVVVTRPVGDADQEANRLDPSESQKMDVVEEKTTSSVAINFHLAVGKEKLPHSLHHLGTADEQCKEVHGSSVAEEYTATVSDATDKRHTEGEIGTKEADVSAADQQGSSALEASKTIGSRNSVTEDQVVVDELKRGLSTVPNGEQQEVSTAVAGSCEVNTKDGVQVLKEKVTTEKRTEVVEVVEPSTLMSNKVTTEVVKKVDDSVKVATETELSEGLVTKTVHLKKLGESSSTPSLDGMPQKRGSSSESGDTSVTTTEETGTGGSGHKEKEEQLVCEKPTPTVTTTQVPKITEKEKAPAQPIGLFGQYKEKFNKLQRESSLKAKESQPAMTRLPGSGKRKLLPSLCGTSDDSPVLKNKKQESRLGKDRSRDAQSDTVAPFKLKFRPAAKRIPAESSPWSPQRAGGPGSPEGIVKERIETYERLIGKTRTFGPAPAPSPTYHKFSLSAGKPSSPHVSGLTIVTSHHQLQDEHEASTEEQISAIATHLCHVEPKDTTKVQDRDDAPEKLLHEALSHLRHTKNSGQEPSSTDPENSSQRISKVPLVLKEAAEHCLSPVPRLTKAY